MPLRIASVMLLLAISLASQAQTKGVVNFGRLKNLEFINQYYNGGTGSLGSGPGPNYGLTFTTNSQVIISASRGGSGDFINNPGNYPVMFFQTGNAATMTAVNGMQQAIWFYYSALQQGLVTVYSGPNATGNILASITLSPNNSGCTGYTMCVWTPVGIPLSTTANSISFSGVPGYVAFDTIHLGSPLLDSMTLTSSQNPSVSGEAVTFTANVTATGAAPVGNVTFKAANQVLGTVPVVGGVASITVSTVKKGSTLVSAKFQGTGFTTIVRSLTQVVN